MKKYLTILFFLLFRSCTPGFAGTYYISNSGSTGNSGTSSSAPWPFSKVNSFAFAAGDNILFNRGEVFYGEILITHGGNSSSPITYGAYGTGALPVISGFVAINSWTNLGSNIWQSAISPCFLPYINLLNIGTSNVPMGCTPNTGFYHYQTHTDSTITSSDLTGSPSYAGAELAWNTTTYTIGRDTILAQSSGTLQHSTKFSGVQSNGQGFRIQNALSTLDQQNEWWWNPSIHKLEIYSTGSPATANIPGIDTLVYDAGGYDYITFNNIAFQGANKEAIELRNAKHISITNCTFDYMGINAIHGPFYGNSTNLTVSNCSFNHSNNCAISVTSDFNNATIYNNSIFNTGVTYGMMQAGGGSATAIDAQGAGNNISYNNILICGYDGIKWFGNGSSVHHNNINLFCTVLTDGGAIYTYNGSNTTQSGMLCYYNIIKGSASDAGIYNDDYSNNISDSMNTISGCYNGIYLHANKSIRVVGNNLYDNAKYGLKATDETYNYFTGLVIKHNYFVSKNTTEIPVQVDLKSANISTFAVSDSNYAARPVSDASNIYEVFNMSSSSVKYSRSGWTTLSGMDAHTAGTPIAAVDTTYISFNSNATNAPVTTSLGGTYKDFSSNSITSITLQPYSSSTLIFTGSAGNIPPVVNAGPDQVIYLPATSASLNGTATDADGTIASVLWTKISGPAGGSLSGSTTNNATATGLQQGSYVFQFAATDNSSATTTDTINVIVNDYTGILIFHRKIVLK